MFDLWCRPCGKTYVVGPRRLVSFHNTSRGPVAYARCPEDHVTAVAFHDRVHSTQQAVPRPGSAA